MTYDETEFYEIGTFPAWIEAEILRLPIKYIKDSEPHHGPSHCRGVTMWRCACDECGKILEYDRCYANPFSFRFKGVTLTICRGCRSSNYQNLQVFNSQIDGKHWIRRKRDGDE